MSGASQIIPRSSLDHHHLLRVYENIYIYGGIIVEESLDDDDDDDDDDDESGKRLQWRPQKNEFVAKYSGIFSGKSIDRLRRRRRRRRRRIRRWRCETTTERYAAIDIDRGRRHKADIFLIKKHTGDNPMILHGDDSNLACNCFRCVYMLYGVCMYVCTWSSTTVLFFLSYTYMVSKGKSRLP